MALLEAVMDCGFGNWSVLYEVSGNILSNEEQQSAFVCSLDRLWLSNDYDSTVFEI